MGLPTRKKIQWSVVATATNGAATATKTGLASHRHYVASVSYSSKGLPAAAVTADLKSQATVKDQWEVPAANFSAVVIGYNHPIEMGIGEDAVLNLPALGAGIVGTVVLKGYTLRE